MKQGRSFEDGHQRIYRTKIPMCTAGINILGRSRRLKIIYRTSEQIRKFAQGILKGLEIDDLDGGVSTTLGDHSVFKGPEPMVEKCETEKAECDAIVAWLKMLMSDYGLATHEVCVTPRKPKIVKALTSADIATFELKPRKEDPNSDETGIRERCERYVAATRAREYLLVTVNNVSTATD